MEISKYRIIHKKTPLKNTEELVQFNLFLHEGNFGCLLVKKYKSVCCYPHF